MNRLFNDEHVFRQCWTKSFPSYKHAWAILTVSWCCAASLLVYICIFILVPLKIYGNKCGLFIQKNNKRTLIESMCRLIVIVTMLKSLVFISLSFFYSLLLSDLFAIALMMKEYISIHRMSCWICEYVHTIPIKMLFTVRHSYFNLHFEDFTWIAPNSMMPRIQSHPNKALTHKYFHIYNHLL